MGFSLSLSLCPSPHNKNKLKKIFLIKKKRKRTARGNGGHKDKALPSVRAAAERGPCPHRVRTDAIQVRVRTWVCLRVRVRASPAWVKG